MIWNIRVSLIVGVIVTANVTDVTLPPYLKSTELPPIYFVNPERNTRASRVFHDTTSGTWFADGHHWTKQIPKPSSFNEIPLVISTLFPLQGDGWDVSGLLVAADLALEHVNDNLEILPGYRLFMAPADSKCNDGVAIHKFFDQLFQAPPKVAVIGPACSVAAQPIASTAHYWNLNVISPSASSPALANRKRYPSFFRIISSETVLNPPIINLIKRYNWTRVATIHHNQEYFILTIDDLLTRLKQSNISVISSEGFYENPTKQLQNLKEQDAKIIIASMYEEAARKLLCEAYKLNMYGEGYVWFITGWYARNWYKENTEGVDCTIDEMTHVAESSNYIGIQEKVLADEDTMTVAGISRGKYETKLQERFKQPQFANYTLIPEVHFGYDSIWAIALALHHTAENFTETSFQDGYHRGLENFSYFNKEMGDILYNAIESVNFTGVSGPVSFNRGERIGIANIEQFQEKCREGWTIHKKYCYLFVASQASWEEADNHCKDEGGFLVSIFSEDENEALMQLGHDFITEEISQCWMSLTQTHEGDLEWSAGPETELRWSPRGNKDINFGRGTGDEHSLNVNKQTCYTLDLVLKSWLPANCTSTMHCFICKNRAEYDEVVVATFDVKKDKTDWFGDIVWPGDTIPLDHTPEGYKRKQEIYEGIPFVVYIIACLAATCGILFAIACLIFNLKFRKQRFIKMSSPNLNSLIIIGCILIYISTCIAGWESLSVNQAIFLKLYQVRVWCFSIAFVLSFGSMFSKTWRVYKVAALKNPKRVVVTDRHLFLMVGALLLVEVTILSAWFMKSPMRVEKELLPIKEDVDDMVILQPYIQYCTSDQEQYWLGALYCYKALLLIFGVFLAWETRKVTIPALNDSKLIGLCVYNAVLLSAIVVGVSLAPTTDPSVSFIFTSAIQIFGTSVTLVIIFVPKMISVMQYPEGKPVTTMNSTTDTNMDTADSADDIKELKTEVEELKAQINQIQEQCPRCQHSGYGFWCINSGCGCFDGIHVNSDGEVVATSNQPSVRVQSLT